MNTNGVGGARLLPRVILCVCLTGTVMGISGCGGSGDSSNGSISHYSIASVSDPAITPEAGFRYEFDPTSINEAGHIAGRVRKFNLSSPSLAQRAASGNSHVVTDLPAFVSSNGVSNVLNTIPGLGNIKITNHDHLFIPGHPYYDLNGAPSAQWSHQIGGRYVYVTDINDADHYAAILTDNADGTGTASPHFVFDDGSISTDLGVPRTGDAVNGSVVINNLDQIAGLVKGAAGDSKIAVYSVPRTSPALIDNSFTVTAFNDGGALIGNTDPVSSNHALMVKNGAAQEIAPITGDTGVIVSAFNNHGDAIGYSWSGSVADVPATPFYYHNGRTINANELLPVNSGWVLTSVAAINNRGQICGVGTYQGVSKIFILTPQ